MRRTRKPSVIGIIFLILLISMVFMVVACEWTISTASNELRTRALDTCRAEIGYISDALYSELTAIQLQNVEILNHESVLALTIRSSVLDRYQTVSYENTIMKLIRSKLAWMNLTASAQLYIPTIHTMITAQKAAGATDRELEEMLDIIRAFPDGLYYTDEYMGFWSASPLIHDVSQAKDSRIMCTWIQRDALRNMLKKYTSDPNGYQLLLTFGSHVIANSDETEWDESIFSGQTADVDTVTLAGSEYYVIRAKHAFSDLSIAAVLPVKNVTRNMDRLRDMLRMLELICLLIVLLSTVSFYRISCKPLKGISTKMQQMGEGDLSVRMAPEKTEELNEVASTFNSMAERLQRLIDREYKARLLAASAEKKALQYQISPHFLYNTYFQLRNLILLEENEQASRMADLMGRYLRYIVHQDSDSATLEEEMEHAYIYADIQGMRFRERIKVRYDVQEGDWRQMVVPRLLVQPLIENAFEHGLKNMDQNGEMLLSLHQEKETLIISVEDNGDGLSDGALEAMQKHIAEGQHEEKDGIALANIHRRLQLYFGDRSGLFVSRSALGGLKAEIRIVCGKEGA